MWSAGSIGGVGGGGGGERGTVAEQKPKAKSAKDRQVGEGLLEV